eukprot:TRINITY_DN9253_c0_g1_i1.p1 TRINITY_DN9253_c0_g1~~TRINITY_DN9253_c0_g1_i1.p1  ORF type:complete len:348 (+),score=139.39 TRINITY_DN9253_c0_g1_i1:68-1111(+)
MGGDEDRFQHGVETSVDGEEPFRLKRAERVLRGRLGNITLVLERCSNEANQQAVLRTAEAMGVQHVYLVRPTLPKRPANKQKERAKAGKGNEFNWGPGYCLTSGCERWLSLKWFQTTEECIACLKAEQQTIWATDLDLQAVRMEGDFAASCFGGKPVPKRVAIVMGNEAEGVSQEMLAAADKRVYLPQYGFTESFNVGVASALVLSRVIDIVGRESLPAEEMAELRRDWIQNLSSNPTITASLAKYLDASAPVPTPLDDLRQNRSNPDGPRMIKKVRQRQEAEKETRAQGEAAAAASQAAAAASPPPPQVQQAPAAASAPPMLSSPAALLAAAACTFALGFVAGRRQ